MTAEIIWTIPTQGDGRDALRGLRRRGDWNPERQTRFASSVRDERPGNFNYFDYLTQVSRAAEAAGFDGLFIPYDPQGEDSWITATALAREAPRLTLLPEFQPGFGTAVYAAKLALSFQRFFSDRLRWKLSLDGDTEEQRTVGDFVTGDDRIRRAEEFLTVTGGVWFESPFSFQGEYFQVEGGGFFGTGLGQELRPGNKFTKQEYPKLYLDGESEVALDLSARRADVHLLSKSEPSLVELAIARHQERAAAYGRQIEFGLRLGVIARETTAEAWRKAERLSSQTGADGDFAASRVDDQLFLGFSDLGFTAPSGLIGSYEEVADRLQAYVDLGISSFILDGLPHLEEAYRVGERVLARLGSRGLATAASL